MASELDSFALWGAFITQDSKQALGAIAAAAAAAAARAAVTTLAAAATAAAVLVDVTGQMQGEVATMAGTPATLSFGHFWVAERRRNRLTLPSKGSHKNFCGERNGRSQWSLHEEQCGNAGSWS